MSSFLALDGEGAGGEERGHVSINLRRDDEVARHERAESDMDRVGGSVQNLFEKPPARGGLFQDFQDEQAEMTLKMAVSQIKTDLPAEDQPPIVKPSLKMLSRHDKSSRGVIDDEKDPLKTRCLHFMSSNKLVIFSMIMGCIFLVVALLKNDGDLVRDQGALIMSCAIFFSLPVACLVLLFLELLFPVWACVFQVVLGFEFVSLVFYYYTITKVSLRYFLAGLLAISSIEILGRSKNLDTHSPGNAWSTIRSLLILVVTYLCTYTVGKILRIRFTQSFSSKSYSYRLLQSLHHEHILNVLSETNPTQIFTALYTQLLQEGSISDDPAEDNNLSPLVWQQLTNYVKARNVDGSLTSDKMKMKKTYPKRFGRKLFHFTAERCEILRSSAQHLQAGRERYNSVMSWPKRRESRGAKKRTKIFKDDLLRYKGGVTSEDYPLERFWTILDPHDKGFVTESEFSQVIEDLFERRQKLSARLKSSRQVIRSLDDYVVAVAIFAVIVAALILYKVELQLIVAMSSTFLGFAFVFGNSMKQSFDSIVYLFIIKPYDLGDTILINNTRFVVNSINLMATIMIRWDGMRITFEHRTLADMEIVNCSKSENFVQMDEFLLDMHCVDTKFVRAVEYDIRAYLMKHPATYNGVFYLYVMNVEDPLKIRLALYTEYNYRKADFDRFFIDQTFLNLAYLDIFRKHGATFSGCQPGKIALTPDGGAEFNSPWVEY